MFFQVFVSHSFAKSSKLCFCCLGIRVTYATHVYPICITCGQSFIEILYEHVHMVYVGIFSVPVSKEE